MKYPPGPARPPLAKPKSWRESDRIQALRALKVLDTPPEERFDRMTRLARRLFDVPIALISLVDKDRQWFKSKQGLEPSETPREWSFCSHAIQDGQLLVVMDALEDERFKDNPLVLEDPSIRFYAGQPIRAPNGAPLGTLCIIDRTPREITPDDEEILKDLANLVEQEFAALKLATVDDLTGLSNRRGFKALARQALALCDRMDRPATVLVFDLDGFKELNDTLGHAAGDAALKSFGVELLATFRDSDVVARLGGDEFCVLLSGTSAAAAPNALAHLAEQIERRNEGREPVTQIRYSVGVADYDPGEHKSVSDLVRAADEAMYEEKRSRK